jgi:hypothetical protein
MRIVGTPRELQFPLAMRMGTLTLNYSARHSDIPLYTIEQSWQERPCMRTTKTSKRWLHYPGISLSTSVLCACPIPNGCDSNDDLKSIATRRSAALALAFSLCSRHSSYAEWQSKTEGHAELQELGAAVPSTLLRTTGLSCHGHLPPGLNNEFDYVLALASFFFTNSLRRPVNCKNDTKVTISHIRYPGNNASS